MLITPPDPSSLAEVIHAFRTTKNFSVAKMAKLLGVSRAYVYRLENGAQIPSEKLAAKLADVLGESIAAVLKTIEEDRARKPEYDKSSSEYQANPFHVKGVTPRDVELRMVPPGDPLPDEKEGMLGPIPILTEGTDPDNLPIKAERVLFFRRESVPAEEIPVRGFAYQISEKALARIRKRGAVPGDYLVFSAEPGPIKAGEIYAVRLDKKIILSRLMEKKGVLILLDDMDEGGIDVIRINESGKSHPVSGRLVIVLRTAAFRLAVRG
jgi:transcriptional regulator with XRE-family HTH domain